MNQENEGAARGPGLGGNRIKRTPLGGKDPNAVLLLLMRAKLTLAPVLGRLPGAIGSQNSGPTAPPVRTRAPLPATRAPPILTKANLTLGFIHKPELPRAKPQKVHKLRKLRHDYLGPFKALRLRDLVELNLVSDDLVRKEGPHPGAHPGPLVHTDRTRRLHVSAIPPSQALHVDPVKRVQPRETRDLDQPVELLPDPEPVEYRPAGIEPLLSTQLAYLGGAEAPDFDEEAPLGDVGLTIDELDDLLD